MSPSLRPNAQCRCVFPTISSIFRFTDNTKEPVRSFPTSNPLGDLAPGSDRHNFDFEAALCHARWYCEGGTTALGIGPDENTLRVRATSLPFLALTVSLVHPRTVFLSRPQARICPITLDGSCAWTT